MIRLRAVTHRYLDRTVLRDVSVDLTEDKVGVIGANGSGKSTLARMLNGLVVPSEGTVTVDGLDTRREGAAVRRRVGFLFSDPDAQIVMPTVAEDLAFSLRRAKLPAEEVRERVAAAAQEHGLGGHLDHPCHLLSSGQKQMLALAAVRIANPQILVCDEPTTLLDLRNTAHVMNVLRTAAEQVVLVTHALDLVQQWPRVLLIEEGRLVDDGPGQQVVAHYRRSCAC